MRVEKEEIYCIYVGFPQRVSRVRVVEALRRLLGWDIDSALRAIQAMSMGVEVKFEFDKWEDLHAFVKELEDLGLRDVFATEESNFNQEEVLQQFKDILDDAASIVVKWWPQRGRYAGFSRPSNGTLFLIDSDAVVQFLSAELVARGARLEGYPEGE